MRESKAIWHFIRHLISKAINEGVTIFFRLFRLVMPAFFFLVACQKKKAIKISLVSLKFECVYLFFLCVRILKLNVFRKICVIKWSENEF